MDNDTCYPENNTPQDDEGYEYFWHDQARLCCMLELPEKLRQVLDKVPNLSLDLLCDLITEAADNHNNLALQTLMGEVERRKVAAGVVMAVSEALRQTIVDSLIFNDADVARTYMMKRIEILASQIKDAGFQLSMINVATGHGIPYYVLCHLLETYNPKGVVTDLVEWRKILGVDKREIKPMLKWNGKKVAHYIRARLLALEIEKSQ
jgi:hypothetical protein